MEKLFKYNAKFDDVLAAEQAITNKSDGLIGLAFSGGGIRSATVNLGVLQALACKNLLGKFDYLSTVSGGGYIGAFLSSLIQRAGGDINAVQAKLGGDSEAKEVNFLRKYSNYLTPKIGFSTDTLAAFSVWLTNTLLNQIVLVSAIATLCALAFALNEWLLGLQGKTNPLLLIIGISLSLTALIMSIKESRASGRDVIETMQADNKIKGLPTEWLRILSIGFAGVLLIALWIALKTHQNESFSLIQKLNLNLAFSPLWLVMPTLVGLICLGIIVIIGLLGRSITIYHKFYINSFIREWWARLGGVTLSLSIGWVVSYMLVFYLPLKLDVWLSNNPFTSISLWGALASLGAFLGKTSSTSGIETQKIKEKVTILLPWLVIAGLVVLVSFAVYKLGAMSYWATFVICFALTAVFASRVDINIFSLHYFYRNRLTRAYLGATNNERNPSLFTGFDPHDDLAFASCTYRPLHIVNTALNLTNAKDLAWQQRLAASFSFTPLYSGFELPNKQGAYQPTSEYAGDKGTELGSIMAVSGAAASPNGGYHTAPATAFLMTMFNARLGRWSGNPLKSKWRNASPPFGLGYLAKELFARANVDSSYVYLSDGGHFENLGIYELVRRHCKLIIAVDAGQDGSYTFEDLGNAIRKCQVDLNITIEINVKEIHPTVQSLYGNFKHANKHFAIGEIIYDKTNPADNGLLVYIKNSLTGHEPTDLINYKLQESAFPHDTTVDQFFNESQFESYRCLGKHIANTVLDDLMKPSGLYERKVKSLLGI